MTQQQPATATPSAQPRQDYRFLHDDVINKDTLWAEMSARLKAGMLDILRDANLADSGQVAGTIRDAIREELRALRGDARDTGPREPGETVLYLQLDGKTFARLVLPYMDKEQVAAWNRNLRLAGV